MTDRIPLKLEDLGNGEGRLREMEAGDTIPYQHLPVGTGAGTVVAGDDERLSNSREWTATTVSQAEAEAGTATTRRAWTAQRVRQAIVAWWNGVTSAWSRGFVNSADAAAALTALGMSASGKAVATGTPAQGRTALGLGAAAMRGVGTSPGNLMEVGAGGLLAL